MTRTLLAMALQLPSSSPVDRAMAEALAGPFGWPGVLIPVLSTLTFFAFIAFIPWLLYRRSQSRTQARSEFHRQLLDKFSSGGEFAAFLNSSGGQRLLEDLWSQRVAAKERVIRSMQSGVVLTVLGLGALGLSMRTPAMLFPGTIILALGAGFLIATAVSYRLSKKLGLLQEQGENEEPSAASQE